MFKQFFNFEVRFWLRSWMLWVFFLIVALMFFGAASSDQITVGTSLKNTYRNAPWVVENFYVICQFADAADDDGVRELRRLARFCSQHPPDPVQHAHPQTGLSGRTFPGISADCSYSAAGCFRRDPGREVHAVGGRGALGPGGVGGPLEGDSRFRHSQHPVYRGHHLCHRRADPEHGGFISGQPGAAGGIWNFPGAHQRPEKPETGSADRSLWHRPLSLRDQILDCGREEHALHRLLRISAVEPADLAGGGRGDLRLRLLAVQLSPKEARGRRKSRRRRSHRSLPRRFQRQTGILAPAPSGCNSGARSRSSSSAWSRRQPSS